MPPTVCVCTPSRGLVHSRTVAAVLAAMDQARAAGVAVPVAGGPGGWWRLSHALPIPDAFNHLAALGLATGADWLWWVEEDMVPPPDALALLLDQAAATDAAIVALDYPLPTLPVRNCISHDPDGAPRWAGLGCTLIARHAFARLPAPWFRTDTTFILERYGTVREALREVAEPSPYGGQDIYFCERAREAGLRLAAVPPAAGMAGHLRLRALGAAQSNRGTHVITAIPPVERWQ